SHMEVITPEQAALAEKQFKPAKKAAAKKAPAKKAPAKKAPAKKTAAKKATAKKATAEKAATEKATAKKATAKKATAKKATAKKAPAKKTTAKKTTAKAAVTKKREATAERAAKPAVEVLRKADQAAAAAVKAERAAETGTVEPEKKDEERPRVIRYAPGFGPDARREEKEVRVKHPTVVPERTDFTFRSQPRRGGGPTAPRSLSTARPAEHVHGGAAPLRGKKRRKKRGPATNEQEVRRSVRQTMASLDGRPVGRKKRRQLGAPQEAAVEIVATQDKKLRILPLSTLAELANAMEVPTTDVIATCLRNGLMVTINQRLEVEDIQLIATEYGYEAEFLEEYGAETEEEEAIPASELVPRPVVVTVMGHVDHGKTKLLDYIRKANVAEGEAGAITQHIGAYSVELPQGRITFLDTPGHEAFTAMRARGTQVTDLVILVVAADDGVMPQTVEAIDHAKAAQVPIIVAVNKMDLPAASPDRVKQELLQHGITVEEFGGQTVVVPISAKFGDGIDKLLEMVVLQAEMLELKGAPDRMAKGSIIEAKKDPGRGIIFTVLVQQGTVRVGDPFAVGLHYGTVRALSNEWGERVDEAGPGMPVAVLGASGVPEAGDSYAGVESEAKAREISTKRQQLRREQEIRYQRRMTLDELYDQISKGEAKELKLLLKGDVSGSVEAMADNFQKMSTDEVKVVIIRKSVGTVNESDVLLAAASNAVIIAFHVRPQVSVRELAKREHVEIRTYDIIYEAVEDVKKAMEGLLTPETKEKVLGTAEVREVFRVPRIGAVAGCYVQEGTIERSARIRILREGVVLGTRKIASLKRFKEDVGKVEQGFECGIGLEDFQDVKTGDLLEAFVTEEVARSL
ncbi:MAG: translation initiation factor IF-2, partial [Candidatus Krumholzibacteriota bacterium]|nr:translation initiation factor IF-2 [Candidatus Krumholzibacteriota bacterium]